MTLPFTREQFFEVFGAYNGALWPSAAVLWAAAVWGAIEVARTRRVGKPVLLMLAVQWAWAGVAYHAAFFTSINPAAWLFSAAFVAESLLLSTARSSATVVNGWRLWLSWLLIVYGLLYPVFALIEHAFPASPTFGVPCPTTILTAGILLACEPVPATRVVAIPILWALLAGSSAFALDVRADLMLVVAAIALTADDVLHRRWFAVA